jgi:hypothetical protein
LAGNENLQPEAVFRRLETKTSGREPSSQAGHDYYSQETEIYTLQMLNNPLLAANKGQKT